SSSANPRSRRPTFGSSCQLPACPDGITPPARQSSLFLVGLVLQTPPADRVPDFDVVVHADQDDFALQPRETSKACGDRHQSIGLHGGHARLCEEEPAKRLSIK